MIFRIEWILYAAVLLLSHFNEQTFVYSFRKRNVDYYYFFQIPKSDTAKLMTAEYGPLKGFKAKTFK